MNPRGVLSPVPLRPDLPGVVHGIVGRDPWVVQCDGCGLVQTHRWLTVAGQNICFDPEDTGRRLCPGCRAVLIEQRENQCENAAERLSQGVFDLPGGGT